MHSPKALFKLSSEQQSKVLQKGDVVVCNHCGWAQNVEGARFCNRCGTALFTASAKKTSGNWTLLGWLILLIGGGGLFIALFLGAAFLEGAKRQSASSWQKNADSTPTATPYVEPTPLWNDLVVVKSNWEKGGFGTVAVWKVTFKNNSDKPIGNIQYRTEYYSETGEKVDKGGKDSLLGGHLIQKVIPPKSTRTIEVNDGFTHSEAHRASFSIVSSEFVTDRR